MNGLFGDGLLKFQGQPFAHSIKPKGYRIDIILIVKVLQYWKDSLLFGFGTWGVHE